MKIVASTPLRKFVEENLFDDQSPENISGRIGKHEKTLPSVSKDSLYRYIKSPYGRRIEYHRNKLKSRRRPRRPRNASLKDRTFIDKRPLIINARKRIGDVEADFLVSGKSGQGVILNVSDRKSRAPFLERIIKVTIENVHRAFQKIKRRFPEMRTITTDNDLLLQHHQELEKILGVKIYFCHAYSSWEKGTVENINGQIRKYIPKGSDLSKYSKKFIQNLEEKLQRKIYQCLDYRTPLEGLTRHRKLKKLRWGAVRMEK